MPVYVYVDPAGHEREVAHPIDHAEPVICPECGLEMWRKPQAFGVNWGGLKPSAGELSPAVRRLIDSAPERRDRFAAKHEAHERRTAQEEGNAA